MMTSGPAIVVPAPGREAGADASRPPVSPVGGVGEPLSAGQATLRAAAANLSARASGSTNRRRRGGIGGPGDPAERQRRAPPQRPPDRPDPAILDPVPGCGGIGVFDEGVLQAFLPAPVAAGSAPRPRPRRLGSRHSSTSRARSSAAGCRTGSAGGSSDCWPRPSSRPGRRGDRARGRAAGPRDRRAGAPRHRTGATIAVRSAAFGDVFGGADVRDDLRPARRRLPGRRHRGRLHRRDHVRLDRVLHAPHPGRAGGACRLVGVALDRRTAPAGPSR